MARKITLKELHTTGSTPPSELIYGEIGITHEKFNFVDENKIKYEEIKCGPRIYTCVDDNLEKNEKITYITDWEIENTLSGLASQTANPSNYGFATLYSGDTDVICDNFINNGIISDTNVSTTFHIKPSKNISDYYQLSASTFIRDDSSSAVTINLAHTGDSTSDKLYFDIENLNDKVFIEQKSAFNVLNKKYVIDDKYISKSLKFTLKKNDDNTILDEIIIDSVFNPTIRGGLNIVSSNNCLVVPINDSGKTVSDIEYNFQIRVYRLGISVPFEITEIKNISSEFTVNYNYIDRFLANITIIIPKDTYVHWGWHDFDIEIKAEDIDGNYNIYHKAVTSVYHNHDQRYVDTTKTGYKNFINDVNETLVDDESAFNNFYNVSEKPFSLADIVINITNEIPLLYEELGSHVVDKDDVELDSENTNLNLKKEVINTDDIKEKGQKLTIRHIRNANNEYSYKVNGEENTIVNTNSSNTFNNITTLPLDENGHLVGEYVNILTANVSGVTFEALDENDNPIEVPEFVLKGKPIKYKFTAQPGYSGATLILDPEDTPGVGIEYVVDDNGNFVYEIGEITPINNTKIVITATTIDASGNTITIKDDKLEDKEFKNYYYETREYKFRGATRDKIGCVYMPSDNIYDNTKIPQPACANKYHKHFDYFYIDREKNYETGYTITGINLISCGSF